MRVGAAAAAAALLAGCSSTPEPQPLPPQPPAIVVCQIPAGMTEREPAPAKPEGEYTQKDVSEYITELHRWGTRGWLRVGAIEDWSESCVQRE